MGGADHGSPQLKGREQVLIGCDDPNGSMRHTDLRGKSRGSVRGSRGGQDRRELDLLPDPRSGCAAGDQIT